MIDYTNPAVIEVAGRFNLEPLMFAKIVDYLSVNRHNPQIKRRPGFCVMRAFWLSDQKRCDQIAEAAQAYIT